LYNNNNIFVRQETEFEKEKKSEVRTDVIQVAGKAALLKKVFSISDHNGAPEGFPRNGCWKGDSVYRNMTEIVPQ